MTADVERKARAQAGKYLTFVLGKEEYGLEILKVREIIGILEITPVPRTPEFIKGVINLRGLVIPVIELRQKFGLPSLAYTPETCIIVVEVTVEDGNVLMGIIVDTVSEVLDIAAADIEPPPQFGGGISAQYILGMGKAKGKVKILLDVDAVLNSDELIQVKEVRR
ncbi:MAG TPA: chemotaxis protein CheW [bacterium]|nr:chemotaxis protein CheW [bacterium]